MPYPNAPKAGALVNKYTRVFAGAGEITQAEAISRSLDPANGSEVRLRPGTIRTALTNPLDKSVNPSVTWPEANIPVSARGHIAGYTAFVPRQVVQDMNDVLRSGGQCARPVAVAVIFGTGTELGRQGLRSFVDRARWRMIVNVPGVEPGYDFAAGQRWGIGITGDQVKQLVTECFGREVPFTVDRLIGFSTGYLGVTGTIRNRLVDLRQVEVLAFFDCNYPEARVQDGIRILRSEAGSRVRVVAYASSGAGTPKAAAHQLDLDVSKGGAVWLFGRPDFQILTHARVLASGLNDKTVDPAEIDASVLPRLAAFLAGLPPRGTVVTDAGLHQLLYGHPPGPGTVRLDVWYAANKREADFFVKALWTKTGTSDELVRLIWKHKLPGWGGGVADADMDRVGVGAFGEGAHDFMPLEFAWEVLGS